MTFRRRLLHVPGAMLADDTGRGAVIVSRSVHYSGDAPQTHA